MAYREALESLVQMLPVLPDEAVENVLVSFDTVLDVAGPELRPVAAELLKQCAAGCANPVRSERLVRAAVDVAAGRSCARNAAGLTSRETTEQLAKIDMATWQPPPDPAWVEAASPDGDDGIEAEEDEATSQPKPRQPKPRQPKPKATPLKAADFRKLNTRKASILHVGGFRPTFDPAASHFGKAPLALPGEEWPTWQSKPLLFVCQMNVSTAPAVPPLLADIQLLTFFIDPELENLQQENGANWRLRAYTSLEGLVPLAVPPGGAPAGARKGFECRWEECDDHPNYDDPETVIPPGTRRPRAQLDNVARTKIGGYASTIQSAPWWGETDHPSQPRFCLQINSEEKAGLVWGDGGTLYIARGTAPGSEDRWFLDWQMF